MVGYNRSVDFNASYGRDQKMMEMIRMKEYDQRLQEIGESVELGKYGGRKTIDLEEQIYMGRIERQMKIVGKMV